MNIHGLERTQRRSREVITPLLIAAGVIGLPLAIGLSQCSSDHDDSDQASGTPPTVSTAQSYPNNYFLPGAGYYHSPFHAWFPFPFNHYVAGRGWYRGGDWRPAATPDPQENSAISRLNASFPRSSPASVADLRAGTSTPTAEAASRANAAAESHFRSTVSRGGFGHSARPSFS